MERTPSSETTTFLAEDRTISVTPTKFRRFTVKVTKKDGWVFTRTSLSARRAAWLCLRAAKGMKKTHLRLPSDPLQRIAIVLYDVPAKGTGVEWITMRMLHGPRPIILKAPALFKHRLIHIEATDAEGIFRMRIVDPFTSQMTEPVEVSQTVVDRALNVFSHERGEDSVGQR